MWLFLFLLLHLLDVIVVVAVKLTRFGALINQSLKCDIAIMAVFVFVATFVGCFCCCCYQAHEVWCSYYSELEVLEACKL